MGSSLSSYHDDEEEYECICKEKRIKPTYDHDHMMWIKYSQKRFKGFPIFISLSWEAYIHSKQLERVKNKLIKLRKEVAHCEQIEKDLISRRIVCQ